MGCKILNNFAPIAFKVDRGANFKKSLIFGEKIHFTLKASKNSTLRIQSKLSEFQKREKNPKVHKTFPMNQTLPNRRL